MKKKFQITIGIALQLNILIINYFILFLFFLVPFFFDFLCFLVPARLGCEISGCIFSMNSSTAILLAVKKSIPRNCAISFARDLIHSLLFRPIYGVEGDGIPLPSVTTWVSKL